jgi:hypothetical protein
MQLALDGRRRVRRAAPEERRVFEQRIEPLAHAAQRFAQVAGSTRTVVRLGAHQRFEQHAGP